jgi:hypothetical protein
MLKPLTIFLLIAAVLVCGCLDGEQKTTPAPSTIETSTSQATTTTVPSCSLPKEVIEHECCLDENRNGACDIREEPAETCSDGIKNQDESGVDCGGVCPVCKPTATKSSEYKASSYWIYNVVMQEPDVRDSEYTYLYEYFGEMETGDGRFNQFAVVPIRLGENNEIIKLTSRSSDYYTITADRIYLNRTNRVLSSGISNTNIYSPALVDLDFPLIVGKTWSGYHEEDFVHGSKNLGNLNINYAAKVLREEEVSVQAGTFDTFVIEKISLMGLYDKVFVTVNETVWYSPKAGRYVKLMQVNTLADNRKEIEVAPRRGTRLVFNAFNWTEELYSYNVMT